MHTCAGNFGVEVQFAIQTKVTSWWNGLTDLRSIASRSSDEWKCIFDGPQSQSIRPESVAGEVDHLYASLLSLVSGHLAFWTNLSGSCRSVCALSCSEFGLGGQEVCIDAIERSSDRGGRDCGPFSLSSRLSPSLACLVTHHRRHRRTSQAQDNCSDVVWCRWSVSICLNCFHGESHALVVS